jgi:hypothetical protein
MFKTNNLFVKKFSIYFLGLAISGLISFMIPFNCEKFWIEKYGIFSMQNVILVLISFGEDG